MSKWIAFAIVTAAVALIGFFLYKNMNNTQKKEGTQSLSLDKNYKFDEVFTLRKGESARVGYLIITLKEIGMGQEEKYYNVHVLNQVKEEYPDINPPERNIDAMSLENNQASLGHATYLKLEGETDDAASFKVYFVPLP